MTSLVRPRRGEVPGGRAPSLSVRVNEGQLDVPRRDGPICIPIDRSDDGLHSLVTVDRPHAARLLEAGRAGRLRRIARREGASVRSCVARWQYDFEWRWNRALHWVVRLTVGEVVDVEPTRGRARVPLGFGRTGACDHRKKHEGSHAPHPAPSRRARNLLACAAVALLTACGAEVSAPSQPCAPASAAYREQSGAGCQKPDGGYFTEADGRVAPTLIVCTDDGGNVVESWCQ